MATGGWVENAVLILISARVGKNGKRQTQGGKCQRLQPKILVEEKVELGACGKVCDGVFFFSRGRCSVKHDLF